MAAESCQMSLVEEKTRLKLQLLEVKIAERRLRYFYWMSPHTQALEIEDRIPLFLGCDVLSKSPFSQQNVQRVHSKFARKGLAAKVNFSSNVTIAGVHGISRGIWCYSIQGLFRIAFEFYSRIEQLACLNLLSSTWKARLDDPLLVTDIAVEIEDDSCEVLECSSTIGEQIHPNEMDTGMSETLEEVLPTNVQGIVSEKDENTVSEKDENSVSEKDENMLGESCGEDENPSEILSPPYEERRPNASCNKEGDEGIAAEEHLKDGDILESYYALRKEDRFTQLHQDSEFLAFLPKLFRSLLLWCQPGSEGDLDEFVMGEISAWLGGMFYRYQDTVNQKVLEFKSQHITTIASLPPAKFIINELFPRAMGRLFLAWMGFSTTEQGSEDSADSCDIKYPIIQLILEFANQTLISGMGHVVYSRLVRGDCIQ